MSAVEETQAEITRLVKLWLPAKGMRMTDLARLLGITPDNLSHTVAPPERRRRKWTVQDVKLLEQKLGVPAAVWWGNAPEEREALVWDLRMEWLDRMEGS